VAPGSMEQEPLGSQEVKIKDLVTSCRVEGAPTKNALNDGWNCLDSLFRRIRFQIEFLADVCFSPFVEMQ